MLLNKITFIVVNKYFYQEVKYAILLIYYLFLKRNKKLYNVLD